MQKTLTLLSLSLTTIVLIGAGCTTTTDSTTEASNTSTANTNTTSTGTVAVNTEIIAEDNSNSAVSELVEEGATETEDVSEEVTTAATQTFDVVASQFAFSPETITVNEGDTVVLNLTTSDVPHGFSLAAFDVNETITPGKTKTVEFVANQTGSFNFSCSVACGSGHGSMSGTLIVE